MFSVTFLISLVTCIAFLDSGSFLYLLSDLFSSFPNFPFISTSVSYPLMFSVTFLISLVTCIARSLWPFDFPVTYFASLFSLISLSPVWSFTFPNFSSPCTPGRPLEGKLEGLSGCVCALASTWPPRDGNIYNLPLPGLPALPEISTNQRRRHE